MRNIASRMGLAGNLIVAVVAGVLLLSGGVQAKDPENFWGKTVGAVPTNFMFGYGSLMNTRSRSGTAGTIVPAIPVRVNAKFGYVRAWNFQSPTSQITALGLRKTKPGKGATINGVLYAVKGDNMAAFDEREEGYTRVEISRDMIEAVSWQQLPPSGKIWVYVPNGPGGKPGEGLKLADRRYPILQSYIDLTLKGAMEYGDEFAREFLETTQDWPKFWLNDRLLPRRPWVHEKKYKNLDKLLKKYPAPADRNTYKHRMLPPEFAIHFAK